MNNGKIRSKYKSDWTLIISTKDINKTQFLNKDSEGDKVASVVKVERSQKSVAASV